MTNFGLRVKHVTPRGRSTAEGWSVYLPHKCDEWDIAGEDYDPVPHAEAVAELEAFIAEAQRALEALRNLAEFDGSAE